MSRRRGYNEIDLWLFKLNTTDTSNQLEQTYSEFGRHFRATQLDDKVYTESDVMFGRARQSEAVERYITKANLDFAIGDNIALIPNPTEHQQATIQKIQRKMLSQRGTKRNTTRQYEYIIEVS